MGEAGGLTHSQLSFYLKDSQYRTAHVCSDLALPVANTRDPYIYDSCTFFGSFPPLQDLCHCNNYTHTHTHRHVKGVRRRDLG